jgi:preprotein translocase subunit SecD
MGALLLTGCQTAEKKKKEKKDEEAATIELHMEVSQDGTKDNGPVAIGREGLFQVNVDKAPFVDTANVVEAKLLDDMGGFVIELKFDWTGTTLLESETTANRGKRIAVLCQYTKNRWLAAPIVNKRITDGVFRFTPDVTREEAERIVRGLNNVIKKLKKDDTL